MDTPTLPTHWKFKDHRGLRYGRLTVVSYLGRFSGHYRWHCLCDCGNSANIASGRMGLTLSCGCLLSHNANSELPYYAHRNSEGFYQWRGEPHESVTHIIGRAPGQHLMAYYGKQAALDCASLLVRAGIQTADEAVNDYIGNLVDDKISLDEAHAGIMEWRHRMVSAEKYRDFKSRIGSLGHHAIYERALGLVEPDIFLDKQRTLNWCYLQTQKLGLFDKPNDPGWTPTERAMDELCEAAYAYILSSDEWLRTAKPRFNAIGQESMIVHQGVEPGHPEFEKFLLKRFGIGTRFLAGLTAPLRRLVLKRLSIRYAGRSDAFMTLVESEYGYPWNDHWPAKEVSLLADFKHSNAINHEAVQQQLCAYGAGDYVVLLKSGEEVETFDLPEYLFVACLHVGPNAQALGLVTEFGTLESKASQLGCKLLTYPDDPNVLESFYGLADHAIYADSKPKAHQQRARRTEPKPVKVPKTVAREASFG